MGLSLV
jgi:hypothetical protein